MKYEDITRRIIGCAMTVHSTLGRGFMEVVYQRALAIEMRLNSLSFEREKRLPIYYRNEDVGSRRVDFFVEECIMTEVKAKSELLPDHLTQAKNHLEASGIEIGTVFQAAKVGDSLSVRRPSRAQKFAASGAVQGRRAARRTDGDEPGPQLLLVRRGVVGDCEQQLVSSGRPLHGHYVEAADVD